MITKDKSYLITGGTGVVGHSLCKRILDMGGKVVVLSRSKSKLKELKEKYKIANKANDLKVIGEGGEIIEPARFSTGREIIVITKK